MRFLIGICFLLVGCAYKNVSEVASCYVKTDAKIESKIDLKEPEVSVFFQDLLIAELKSRLNISNVKQSPRKIIISNSSYAFSPIQYDALGYIASQKVNVCFTATVQSQTNVDTFVLSAVDYFTLENTTSLTRELQTKVLISSISKAIDDLIYKLAQKGYAQKVCF